MVKRQLSPPCLGNRSGHGLRVLTVHFTHHMTRIQRLCPYSSMRETRHQGSGRLYSFTIGASWAADREEGQVERWSGRSQCCWHWGGTLHYSCLTRLPGTTPGSCAILSAFESPRIARCLDKLLFHRKNKMCFPSPPAPSSPPPALMAVQEMSVK